MAQIEDLQSKGITTGKRWRVDYRDGKGNRKRKSFAKKREAEAYLAEVATSLNSGSYVDPKHGGRLTVSVLWSQYVERMETVGAGGRGPTSAKTLDGYRRQWENYIEPRWGDTRLASVHYEDVHEWVTTLRAVRDGKSAGAETRKAVGTMFIRLMDYAVKRQYLARNPTKDAGGQASYIPGKREVAKTKRDHVFLTMPELVAIADQCDPYRDLILFTGTCGLRWGEVSALQVRDVRLDDKPLVHVQRAHKDIGGRLEVGDPKSGEKRRVPIPGSVVSLLAERIEGKAPADLVFPSPSGRPLRNANFTKRFYTPAITAAASASSDPASFPRPTFHDLRHTAVSLAISQGANVLVVQRIAGHADATMTLNIYAGLFDDDLFDSAARIDKALVAASAA